MEELIDIDKWNCSKFINYSDFIIIEYVVGQIRQELWCGIGEQITGAIYFKISDSLEEEVGMVWVTR